jgi:hypothetical protein
VTYNTSFGLVDRIYCTLYIHTTRDCRKYSAIADLHTLQFTVSHELMFSVFTSRILAMELQLSHCHFESHMKSSFHRLIPFLQLFCSCQFRRLYLIQFHAHILVGWSPETRLFTLGDCPILGYFYSTSWSRRSLNHIATDCQSISKSWCRAQTQAHDQIFITL